MNYLTACLMVKDEDKYLKEWVAYHIMMGVEKIYIYDNNSKNSPSLFLKKEIEKKLVEVFEFKPTEKFRHGLCFIEFVKKYYNESIWTIFTDIDEFILLKKHTDIKELLVEYEQYGGLGIMQYKFTNEPHIKSPDGLVIENYQQMSLIEQCTDIKTIGQLRRIKQVCTDNPHWFEYNDPYYCVDELHRPCNKHAAISYTEELIRLNHYWTKSQEDMQIKLERGGGNGLMREPEQFNNFNNFESVKNTEILKELDRLKKYMYI